MWARVWGLGYWGMWGDEVWVGMDASPLVDPQINVQLATIHI